MKRLTFGDYNIDYRTISCVDSSGAVSGSEIINGNPEGQILTFGENEEVKIEITNFIENGDYWEGYDYPHTHYDHFYMTITTKNFTSDKTYTVNITQYSSIGNDSTTFTIHSNDTYLNDSSDSYHKGMIYTSFNQTLSISVPVEEISGSVDARDVCGTFSDGFGSAGSIVGPQTMNLGSGGTLTYTINGDLNTISGYVLYPELNSAINVTVYTYAWGWEGSSNDTTNFVIYTDDGNPYT